MFVDADAEELAESSNGERLAAAGDSQWRDVDRVQNEIDSLQRSFRSVESTRHSLRAKDPRPLRVRRRQFGKLKKQGQEARDNLRLESERAYTSVKHSISNRLAALSEQADRFHRAIAREKNTVDDLDAQCNELMKTLYAQRQSRAEVLRSRESVHYMQKRLRLFESKLDNALQKYSEALSHNKRLKEGIEDHRRERSTYDTQLTNTESELQSRKRAISRMVEQSLHLFDVKESYETEAMELRRRAKVEMHNIEARWLELAAVLSDDRRRLQLSYDVTLLAANAPKTDSQLVSHTTRLRELSISEKVQSMGDDKDTEQDAVEPEQRQQQQQHQQQPQQKRKQLEAESADTVALKEAMLRKSVIDSERRIGTLKKSIRQARQTLSTSSRASEEIVNATNVNDIEKLVDSFVQTEQENFFLFSKITSINGAIEGVHDELLELDEQKISLLHKREDAENERRLRIVMSINRASEDCRQRCTAFESEIQEGMKTMHVIKQQMHSFASNLGLSLPTHRFVEQPYGTQATPAQMLQEGHEQAQVQRANEPDTDSKDAAQLADLELRSVFEQLESVSNALVLRLLHQRHQGVGERMRIEDAKRSAKELTIVPPAFHVDGIDNDDDNDDEIVVPIDVSMLRPYIAATALTR